ncbi:MAG TPA: biotin-dependent carboxyltransferase family protein [Ilumatobacteraceae bacterium]|nr:biotin-dependent carboxyltransferase family protein [Ilumatobacteraceae bacterium]
MIVVQRTGAQVLVQDDGRPGFANIGVSPSGAADRTSWALANHLIGNRTGGPAFEILLGGLQIRWTGAHALWIALTGAPAALSVNRLARPNDAAVLIHPGDVVDVGIPTVGLRSYLAVRGGLRVATTLGSASSDVLSGLGPPPVAIGDQLPVGRAQDIPPNTPGRRLDLSPNVAIEISPGPRLDWFSADALDSLTATRWTVDMDSNRIATRLDGPPLARRREGELPSEAILRGAIQIPPNGRPVIFGSDHPTTGGYPVIAVATPESVDRLAQARPGAALTLRLA